MSELTDLQLEFVRCRTYGHSCDEYHPLKRVATVFSWQTHLRCTRCTTTRHDSYDSLGGVVQREYAYVEGYSLAEKLTRAQFRLELRRRARSGGQVRSAGAPSRSVSTRARGRGGRGGVPAS